MYLPFFNNDKFFSDQTKRSNCCGLGSSDFPTPRSLCFRWLWFGLEILRLVYKKRFLKYWTVSILFDLLTSNKIAPSHIRAEKNSSKLGAKGIKRSRILCWFQKCVELFRQEVPKDFFSEKCSFEKLFKPLKNQFFFKNCFPLLLNSGLLHFF